MTNGSSHTVVARIPAADDQYMFSLGGYIGFVCQVGIEKTFGCHFQEIHGITDSVGISSRYLDISGLRCAAGQNYAVEFF